jgi:acyl dehydratase
LEVAIVDSPGQLEAFILQIPNRRLEETISASEATTKAGLRVTLAELPEHEGELLGRTGWQRMTQDLVDRFADLTDDHNFIHVDPERAAQTPFKGTIAHGFLTLSLLAPISRQLLRLRDSSTGINYGLDKVRFPAPLPVGADFRGSALLSEARRIAGGVQVKLLITVEVKDAEKPALVAECLFRHFA